MKLIIPLGFMLIVLSITFILIGTYKFPEIIYTFSWGMTFGLILAIGLININKGVIIEYKKGKWWVREI